MFPDNDELVRYLITHLIMNAAMRMVYDVVDRYRECAAIEQATIDREFWELVGVDDPGPG